MKSTQVSDKSAGQISQHLRIFLLHERREVIDSITSIASNGFVVQRRCCLLSHWCPLQLFCITYVISTIHHQTSERIEGIEEEPCFKHSGITEREQYFRVALCD